jgi:hypothetical protein
MMVVTSSYTKSLWCDSIYRQNISTIEFHCQLMLMFSDYVMRLHHVGIDCREYKSGLASIMKVTPFIQADQEHVSIVQVAELVLEKPQDTIQDLSTVLE